MDFPTTDAGFIAFLRKLDRLTREHLLVYRLQVGGLVLEQFFSGDITAYLSRDPTKPQKFTRFLEECGPYLAELGLGETVLRQCVVARGVVDALPKQLRTRLLFSHLVELSRVDDLATRALVARAAVDNGWTIPQIRGAVQAVRDGRWIDADLEKPGIQPPAVVVDPPPTLQPGRVVSRFERSVGDLDDLTAQWERVASRALSPAHRGRLRAAVVALKERVASLERAIGPDDPLDVSPRPRPTNP